jgi:hypothetical protein
MYIHMARKIAVGLLLASLILLLIYGLDVAVASSAARVRGFLPFDEAIRGGAFGGGAVVMSIIAFAISRKDYAPMVSILLFVNGGLIIVGMAVLIVSHALRSESSSGAIRTVASTMGIGAILIGLGAWKAIIDKKAMNTARKETAQK